MVSILAFLHAERQTNGRLAYMSTRAVTIRFLLQLFWPKEFAINMLRQRCIENLKTVLILFIVHFVSFEEMEI